MNMNMCLSVTDAVFVHLRGIKSFSVKFCDQATITGAGFAHLRGICNLNTSCHAVVKAAAEAVLSLGPVVI